MIARNNSGRGRYEMKRIRDTINFILSIDGNDHTGAYAAMSAFFFVLSMIPLILLLLTMVQYTPVTKADVMTAVVKLFPESVNSTIVVIINQVYNQSRAIIPITALVALWSACRGVLAMTSGLNCIYRSTETRNYIYLRFRAMLYTVLFLVIIVLSLVVLGFGNSISLFVERHIPIATRVVRFLIRIRTVTAFFMLTGFSLLIYRFLPNKKGSKWRDQIPGSIFTSVGWLFTSFFVSKYMEIFKGFENMYGSLTTIVLIMLWLYFSMYIILLGGKLNMFFKLGLADYLQNKS